jgi:hypothetical protein
MSGQIAQAANAFALSGGSPMARLIWKCRAEVRSS